MDFRTRMRFPAKLPGLMPRSGRFYCDVRLVAMADCNVFRGLTGAAGGSLRPGGPVVGPEAAE